MCAYRFICTFYERGVFIFFLRGHVWIVVNFSLDVCYFLSSLQWISRDQRCVVFLLRWLNQMFTSPLFLGMCCVIGGRHNAIFNFRKNVKIKVNDECISRAEKTSGEGGGRLFETLHGVD